MTSTLSGGNHTITAFYNGDANFLGGSSNTLTQTVNQATTTTTVTTAANPAVFGQAVIFTATVSATTLVPGAPSGTVTFQDGAATLGTAPLLAGGKASITASGLTVGSHTITASYGGDSNFAISTSVHYTETVNQASTTTTVTSSANPGLFSQPVTITATVSAKLPGSGTPTGTVTFLDGGTSVGTSTVTGGMALYPATSLSSGNHLFTASYNGDSNFLASVSAAYTQTINRAGTTTTVSSASNPSVFGQTVTFTATVSVVTPATGTPTGMVTFLDGGSVLSTAALTGTTASCTTSGLSVGSHTITAVYGGDSNFSTSIASNLTQTVNKAGTTTTLTASLNTTIFSQAVTFTAAVGASSPGTGTPTGSVAFKYGYITLGTMPLAAGTASFPFGGLPVGSDGITAEYKGDANFSTSVSVILTQTVNQAGTSSSLSSSAGTIVFGQPLTVTATVTANLPAWPAPAGTVTFQDGGSSIGGALLGAGGGTAVTAVAQFTISSLSVAGHSITAVYNGNANFSASSSNTLPETVNKASTTAMLTSLRNPAVVGQVVTFTANVTASSPGSGTPTGTVTFQDGASSLGTALLIRGTVAFPASALTLNSHSITAVYFGDSNFLGELLEHRRADGQPGQHKHDRDL